PFGWPATLGLLGHPGQVEADVGAGPPTGILVPVEGLSVAQGASLVLQFAQAGAGVLGDGADSGFAQAQAAGLGPGLQRRFFEAVAGHAQQTDDALGAGREAMGAQAGLVVEGEDAGAAAAAVVVATAQVNGAEEAHDRLLAVAFERG